MKTTMINLMRIVVLFCFVLTLSLGCKTTKDKSVRFRFALVQYNDSPLSELSRQGITDGLLSEGFKEGKDYEMKVYNAQGDIGTLNLIFDGVVNNKPDLIFVTSTPTLQVAVKKIKEIPVVFTVIADPVAAGAGKSFQEHLPNITGISTLGDYKRMPGMIKKILPQTKKIGTIFTPGETNSVVNMNELKKYAEAEGLELITMPVTSSNETADATRSLIAKKPDLVCQIVDNLTSVSVSSIIKECQSQNMPMFGFVSDQAEKGAVLVLSRDYIQAGIDATRLAKKIIDGMNPGAIPFEFVSKTNILINPAAAARYGITIPEEIMSMENVIVIKQ
jgi:ABC-type uncharacterized transport system substrate-binding protein